MSEDKDRESKIYFHDQHLDAGPFFVLNVHDRPRDEERQSESPPVLHVHNETPFEEKQALSRVLTVNDQHPYDEHQQESLSVSNAHDHPIKKNQDQYGSLPIFYAHEQPLHNEHQPVPSSFVYSYDQDSDTQYAIDPEFHWRDNNNTISSDVIIDHPSRQMDIVDRSSSSVNYCVLAILSVLSLCCFLPTGICAVVFALNSATAADRGDILNAKRKSLNVRYLSILSAVIGVSISMVFVILKHVVFDTK